MTTTAQQLAALKDTYARGALSLEQNGEKVTFVSGSEIRLRIKALERQLVAESGAAAGGAITYPTFSKGL
jgi:hypothetical protein